jgi:hypothetical protein
MVLFPLEDFNVLSAYDYIAYMQRINIKAGELLPFKSWEDIFIVYEKD